MAGLGAGESNQACERASAAPPAVPALAVERSQDERQRQTATVIDSTPSSIEAKDSARESDGKSQRLWSSPQQQRKNSVRTLWEAPQGGVVYVYPDAWTRGFFDSKLEDSVNPATLANAGHTPANALAKSQNGNDMDCARIVRNAFLIKDEVHEALMQGREEEAPKGALKSTTSAESILRALKKSLQDRRLKKDAPQASGSQAQASRGVRRRESRGPVKGQPEVGAERPDKDAAAPAVQRPPTSESAPIRVPGKCFKAPPPPPSWTVPAQKTALFSPMTYTEVKLDASTRKAMNEDLGKELAELAAELRRNNIIGGMGMAD